MLVRVTGPTSLVWGFALCGVCRQDAAVAASALGRHGLCVQMWAVTIQTRGRRVHGHGRDRALRSLMAARALARLVRLQRPGV